jgi:hypothetical protein
VNQAGDTDDYDMDVGLEAITGGVVVKNVRLTLRKGGG